MQAERQVRCDKLGRGPARHGCVRWFHPFARGGKRLTLVTIVLLLVTTLLVLGVVVAAAVTTLVLLVVTTLLLLLVVVVVVIVAVATSTLGGVDGLLEEIHCIKR